MAHKFKVGDRVIILRSEENPQASGHKFVLWEAPDHLPSSLYSDCWFVVPIDGCRGGMHGGLHRLKRQLAEGQYGYYERENKFALADPISPFEQSVQEYINKEMAELRG